MAAAVLSTQSFPNAPIAHKERKHQNWAGSSYILPSDEDEDDRLLLQHNVLKKAYQGRLILAPVDLTDGTFILDNGCGTGIWSIEVSQYISPNVTVKGVDISSNLFPSPLPPNVELCVASLLDLPSHWSNTFTLINQRLLLAALTAPQWETALKESLRVLAPGGWAQFGEAGSWHSGPVTRGHREMMKEMYVKKGLLLNVAEVLPSLLLKAGFVNVCMEKRMLPLGTWAGTDGARVGKNFADVFRAMKTALMNYGGLGYVRSEKEFDAWLDRVEQEWNETEGSEMEFYTFYAQKPVL